MPFPPPFCKRPVAGLKVAGTASPSAQVCGRGCRVERARVMVGPQPSDATAAPHRPCLAPRCADLILNAVGLTFVKDVDELMFSAICDQETAAFLEATRPITYPRVCPCLCSLGGGVGARFVAQKSFFGFALRGPWTVVRCSLRMLRRVAAFCRPLRPVLPLVSFPRSRSAVVGAPGVVLVVAGGRFPVFAAHSPPHSGRPPHASRSAGTQWPTKWGSRGVCLASLI